jgi:hypothetical protein
VPALSERRAGGFIWISRAFAALARYASFEAAA